MTVGRYARYRCALELPTEVGEGPYRLALQPAVAHFHQSLLAQHIHCRAPQWWDYEFGLICDVESYRYEVSVGHDLIYGGWFDIGYQRTLGFFKKLIGRSEDSAMLKLSTGLHTAMRAMPGIKEIRWYDRALEDPDTDYFARPELC